MGSDNAHITGSAGQVFLTAWNFLASLLPRAVCPELNESNRNLPNLVL
jgi:hypothetical protein